MFISRRPIKPVHLILCHPSHACIPYPSNPLFHARVSYSPVCMAAFSSLVHQASSQETPSMQLQSPSGRIAGGFLSNKWKLPTKDEDSCLKSDSSVSPSKKKPLVFSFILSFQFRNQSRSHECPHIVVGTPGRILALARDKDLALKM
ncbi:hypothetical protein AAG906_015783 [Vitis piasezkii]